MSAYLTFRKNGIDLVSFNRSMLIVEVMGTPGTEDFVPFDKNRIQWAYKELDEKEKENTEHLQILDKVFQGKLDSDDIYCLIQDYKETKEELEDIMRTRINIELLEMIFEEETYNANHECIEPVIEWSYG